MSDKRLANRGQFFFAFFFLSLLAYCCSPSALFSAEDLNVQAQVDKSEVKSGQVLTYSVTIAGPIKETPKIHLTGFEGFQVVSTGQSQRIQVRGGQTRLTLTLNYTLAPTAPGTHTLGPVKVEYHGQVYETQPIEVTVAGGLEKKKEKKEEEETEMPNLEGGIIL